MISAETGMRENPAERRGQAEDALRVKKFLFLALLMVSAAVSLDTLFHLSNESYFSNLGGLEKLAVFLNSISLLLVPVAVMAIVLGIAAPLLSRASKVLASAGMLVFWAVATATAFVHIDAWFYTSFKVNVADLHGLARYPVLAIMGLSCYWLFRKYRNILEELFGKVSRAVIPLYGILFSVLILSLTSNSLLIRDAMSSIPSDVPEAGSLPDIIIFSTDGVGADHMNVYGYERKTTRYINKFAESSTIYMNAYSNCSHSRCSDIVTVTGKSPLETKVMFDPDILVREDSFEHLPALLSRLGYYNVYHGEGYHCLPRNYNLRHSFHALNGVPTGFESRLRASDLLGLESYYLWRLLKLYHDKLGYLAGSVENFQKFEEFGAAFDKDHYKIDEDNVVDLLELLKTDKRPIFAFLHPGGAHGPRYIQDIAHFSKGKVQDKDWDIDFYDDAILAQDYLFGLIMGELIRTGRLDNALIIFKTDHGMNWKIRDPLPLLVHLPGQTEKRVVEDTVDYLDIAPSLVKYLGLPVPGFMRDSDIFSVAPDNGPDDRIVFGAVTELALENGKVVNPSPGPPFYGIKRIVASNKEFQLAYDLRSGKAKLYRTVKGDHEPYFGNPAVFAEFYEKTTGTLRDNGFPVSSE
jgi:hypothetical protein